MKDRKAGLAGVLAAALFAAAGFIVASVTQFLPGEP
jgi:hypothetical protein